MVMQSYLYHCLLNASNECWIVVVNVSIESCRVSRVMVMIRVTVMGKKSIDVFGVIRWAKTPSKTKKKNKQKYKKVKYSNDVNRIWTEN